MIGVWKKITRQHLLRLYPHCSMCFALEPMTRKTRKRARAKVRTKKQKQNQNKTKKMKEGEILNNESASSADFGSYWGSAEEMHDVFGGNRIDNAETEQSPRGVEQKHRVCSLKPSAIQSLNDSGSSSHSSCMLQEVCLKKPQLPPRMVQPSSADSTWHHEQLASFSNCPSKILYAENSSAEEPSFFDTGRVSSNERSSHILLAHTHASNQTLHSMPQPPTKATHLKDRAAKDSSLEDLSRLLSQLDLSIGQKDQQVISGALASGLHPTREYDTSRIYREAITRLNEVRILQVQTLMQRIEQLENYDRCGENTKVSWTQTFSAKVQGLPRILPVKPKES